MALNFPDPSQSPYTDPVSGLKYVYNTTVQAWEAAIQPPVIVTGDSVAADIEVEGFLWYNPDNRSLNVYTDGRWVQVSAPGGADGDLAVEIGQTPPPSIGRADGDFWWDTISGQLYIWYNDGDSSQWVPASPTLGVGMNANVISQDNPPEGPITGDVWFNTSNNVLYVYHGDKWIATQATTSGVDKVLGTYPIEISEQIQGSAEDGSIISTVSIAVATTDKQGSVRLSNVAEVNNATASNTALSPGRLADALKGGHINSYINRAKEGNAATDFGVVQFATEEEVASGITRTKAVSPKTLKEGVSSFGKPVGTIIAFAGFNAPAGYLICDGTKIIQGIQDIQGITADLTVLYDVVGTFYSGNANDHCIPDLRGEFLRGYSGDTDNSTARPFVDAGRAFGSFQVDSSENLACRSNVEDGITTLYGVNSNNANPANSETRPRNIAINYCIKY